MKTKTIVFFLLLQIPFTNLLAHPLAVSDMSQLNDDNAIVPLDGNWEFYWNQFYFPADFENGLVPEPDLYTPTGSWNKYEINGKPCGSYGYATYRITLINLPNRELVLDAYNVQTTCRIFLNGKQVVQIGRPGTTKESSKPMNREEQVIISAGQDSLEIIVHISNFHHRKGGFEHPFEIGTPEAIVQQRLMYFILDCIESAALAIIGLFLLALYVFRRKDLSVLFFSVFCLTLSLRPVISVNYLLAFIFPDINWFLMIKLEYLGVVLPCLFMLLYLKQLFPKQLPKFFLYLFGALFLIMTLIIVFFPPAIFSWLVLPILVLIPAGICVLVFTIIRAVIAKIDGANYAGIGVIVLFISLILKILSYAHIIPYVHVLITTLDIAFIFMMSLILGSRFSLQFVKVETLQEQTEQQRAEIEQKKDEVEAQKETLEEKNKEILDSINYAKRIQTAILPSRRVLRELLPDHFILYQPKDIVAGDFYWLEQKNDTVLLAAADCTGHGVPGSLVSVICNNGLNRSVREYNLTKPADILDKTREIILSEFEKSDDDVKDGMDISLVAFSKNATQIQWSGANNALCFVSENQLHEIKPDKQPVGKFSGAKAFTNHTLHLKKGDVVYLFTDGFADQFGGEKGKKFKYSALKELLLSVSTKPMNEQKQILENTFHAWKKGLEQIDDVCIIGMRL